MGNCICPTPIDPNPIPQEKPEIHVALTPLKASSTSSATSTRRGEVKQQRRNKRVVKIDQCEESVEGNESKPGEKGVRIRVVLTQQELKEILDEFHNGESKCTTSMEVLLRSALKRRRRLRDCNKGGWRPALQSIPEDA